MQFLFTTTYHLSRRSSMSYNRIAASIESVSTKGLGLTIPAASVQHHCPLPPSDLLDLTRAPDVPLPTSMAPVSSPCM